MCASFSEQLRKDAKLTTTNGDGDRIWQFDGLEMAPENQGSMTFYHGGSGTDGSDFGTIWSLQRDGKLRRRAWRGDNQMTEEDQFFAFPETSSWDLAIAKLQEAFEAATAGIE